MVLKQSSRRFTKRQFINYKIKQNKLIDKNMWLKTEFNKINGSHILILKKIHFYDTFLNTSLKVAGWSWLIFIIY